ncbi:MAG TPA: T9SS type A sorting domain-containing protein [Bacteroidales bacterium]|nr:T9SS type A sorting domain-containing protein [Bacteroidales bacterium]
MNNSKPISKEKEIYFVKKNFSLYILILATLITPSIAGYSQTTVTIGSGTNSQAQPFNAFYGYGRSASIFTSDQVTSFGTITHLGWYVATSQAFSIPVKIYLKETSLTTFTATTWANLTLDATLVYDGNVSFSSTGWFTIDISDYLYSSTNLMVLCEVNYGGGGTFSYPAFRYSSASNKHIAFAQDNTAPTGNGTVNANRPNIQITIVDCTMVGGTATATDNTINFGESTSVNCSGYSSSGSELQWEQSVDGATGWTNVTGGSGATTATYTTPNLSETTYYRLKVIDENDEDCYEYSSASCITVVCGVNGGTAVADDSEIYMGESTEISCTGYTLSGTSLQWQQSANGTTGWENVVGGSGATTNTYETATLSSQTYFCMAVNDGVCTSYSNVVSINTVCSVTDGGTATAVSSSIPMGETTVINCVGYSISATQFQWQQSPNGTNSWTNVTGGIGAYTDSYTTGALTVDTYYRVIVSDGYCSAYSSVEYVQATLSNDECANAILLNVNDACSYEIFNNTGATISSGIPAPGCAGSIYKDIWCKFVVPENGHVEISTQLGSVNDMAMAIYSGTCGSLTLIECVDDSYGGMPIINRPGLTPGETIYIRLWEYGGNAEGTFGICISIPAPIAPDECVDAIELTVGSVCEYFIFDNTGCTESSGVSNPDCGTSNHYYDVWFKCEIPESGNVRISTTEITGSTLTDCAMAVYSGTCGSLTQIACNNDYVYIMNRMPLIDIYDETPGSTIYIRFWDIVTSGKTNGRDEGVCKICVYELPGALSCVSSIVPEDLCENAPMISSLDGYCGNTSATYNPEAPGNLSVLFCGSIENNSWLTFTASEEIVQLNIYVSNCYSDSHSWGYPTSGVQMQVYGTSDCSTFSAYSECWFPGIPTSGFLTAEGLTPGETYYLMIDGVYGDNCDYIIGASEGTIILPVLYKSIKAVCKDDYVEIEWVTSSEKNCHKFEIQKSYNAKDFWTISTTFGAGNSLLESYYSFFDYDLLTDKSDKLYYRIKQIDYDGKVNYSKTITASCYQYVNYNISIYPNPSSFYFCLNFTNCDNLPQKIEICELSGSVILTKNIESDDNYIICFENEAEIKPGYYLVNNYFGSNIVVLKLIKV